MRQLLRKAKKPRTHDIPVLFRQPTAFNEAVLSRCHLLQKPYLPPLWARNAQTHTVMAVALRKFNAPRVEYQTEVLHTPDGGMLQLSWDSEPPADDAPVLVIIPGLTSSESSGYVRQQVLAARKQGFRVVVCPGRGFGCRLATAMVSTSVDVSDFELAVNHVAKQTGQPVTAVGFSMGANILVKMLGQRPHTPLCAAVSVDNAFDYNRLAAAMKRPTNSHLSFLLAHRIRRMLEANRAMLEPVVGDWRRIARATSVWSIDDRFTRRVYGIGDIHTYYSVSSSLPYVQHVQVPLLCLNSSDDPFLGMPIPSRECMKSPHVISAVTRNGGHLGWFVNPSPSQETHENFWAGSVASQFLWHALQQQKQT